VSKLELVKTESFGGVVCDLCRIGDEVYMTREQVGLALEYERPNDAIRLIHERHQDRLDPLSTSFKVTCVEGARRVKRDMIFYTAKGIYEICRWSQQPKANVFYDFVYDMLEALRKGEATLVATKAIRRELTDTLRDTGEDDRMCGHSYELYTNLIYKRVLGKSAKQLREEMGLPRTANVRDHLPLEQRVEVARLEDAVKAFLALGYGYYAIKGFLEGNKALSA
jgi:prophage antirepressor-like protein